MKEQLRKIVRSRLLEQWIVDGISFIIVLLGIAVSIRMLLVGRALWYDESALAYSVCQRSLSELTSTELDYVQSAPVLWLYAVKLFSLVFGISVYALRVPSVLSYAGILLMLYLLFKNTFRVSYPMAGVAFAASFPLLVLYSDMFKPYISDGFFCLLAIYLFYLNREKKIGVIPLAVSWSILIWCSNPVVFVEAGILVSHFYVTLFDQERGSVKKCVKFCVQIGIPMIASFLGYYFYWLRQTAVYNRSMLEYWADWHFPLIPRSMADIKKAVMQIGYLFGQFYRLQYIVMILLAALAVWALQKRNRYILGAYFGIAIAFFASWLEKFPINKRLWLFMYPLLIVVLFTGLDSLINREDQKRVSLRVVGIVLLGMALLNGGIRYYAQRDNVYWPGYEVGMEYDYLLSVIRDEPVYVFEPIIPEFAHVNRYETEYLYGTDHPVILGRSPLGEDFDCAWDLETILNSDRIYLFFSDSWDQERLTGELFVNHHDDGYLELVYNDYETPLWHYARDISDTKADASVEIIEREDDGDRVLLTVRVTNTGSSYLNPKFETAVLTNCFEHTQDRRYLDTFPSDDPKRQSFEIPENLAPGDSFEVTVPVNRSGRETFQICNEYGPVMDKEFSLSAE